MKFPVPKVRYLGPGLNLVNHSILGGKEEAAAYREGMAEARRQLGLEVELRFELREEVEEWRKWYVPPSSIRKDDLILNVGARDGDSILFLCLLGYRNFRGVEPDTDCFSLLQKNAVKMREFFEAKIELRHKPFDISDFEAVKFGQVDCEGCERNADLESLGIPIVAEMHQKIVVKDGIYQYSGGRAEYRRFGKWD